MFAQHRDLIAMIKETNFHELRCRGRYAQLENFIVSTRRDIANRSCICIEVRGKVVKNYMCIYPDTKTLRDISMPIKDAVNVLTQIQEIKSTDEWVAQFDKLRKLIRETNFQEHSRYVTLEKFRIWSAPDICSRRCMHIELRAK